MESEKNKSVDEYFELYKKINLETFGGLEAKYLQETKLGNPQINQIEINDEMDLEVEGNSLDEKMKFPNTNTENTLCQQQQTIKFETTRCCTDISTTAVAKTKFEIEHGFQVGTKNIIVEVIKKNMNVGISYVNDYLQERFKKQLEGLSDQEKGNYSAEKWNKIRNEDICIYEFILDITVKEKYQHNFDLLSKISNISEVKNVEDEKQFQMLTFISTPIKNYFEIILKGATNFFEGNEPKENEISIIMNYFLKKRQESNVKNRKISDSDFIKMHKYFWEYFDYAGGKNRKTRRQVVKDYFVKK